jgi:hypothetical protein
MITLKTLMNACSVMGLAIAVTLGIPLDSKSVAAEMSISDDEGTGSELDNGNSEDHANENANERATGDEEQCGSTIENSRC